MALCANGTLVTWGMAPAIPNQTTLSNVVENAGIGGFFSGGGMALTRPGNVFAAGAPPSATNIMTIGGSGSTYFAVKATGPPIFPLPPVRRAVVLGKDAYLRARAVGALPITCQWTFYGTNLPSATNEVLVVTNVQASTAGSYILTASNSLGVASAEIVLNAEPLEATVQPGTQTVLGGSNATFTAATIGNGPFTYQWKFDGQDVPGATTNFLTLTNVSPGQAGKYSVSISNLIGGMTSQSATLSVLPLTIAAEPTNVVALLWSPVIFSVSVLGQDPFSYQWLFNGTNLDGATANPLVLTNAHLRNAGTYSVAVTNVYGAVTTSPATLALRQVEVWGDNGSGQANFPPGLTNIKAIAAGYFHNVALREDGSPLAWGSYYATNVPPDVTNIIAITAGDSFSVGLKADGTVTWWGAGFQNSGALPPNISNVVAVSSGEYHTLALKADGTIVAWGAGSTNAGTWPDLGQSIVPAGLSNVVAVSAGGAYSLALKDNGTLVAWGANDAGQTNIPAGLSNVVGIAAGFQHALALRADGTVLTWGNNDFGQTNVPPDLTNVASIAAGSWNSLALTEDNRVMVWGRNDYGQTNVPAGFVNVMAIAGGNYHLAALLVDELPPPGIGLASAAMGAQSFNISVPSQSGKVYRLEHKNDLSDHTWIAHPLVAGTGGTLTFTDPTATGAKRFYRLHRW